jgi:hypothetical protein
MLFDNNCAFQNAMIRILAQHAVGRMIRRIDKVCEDELSNDQD